MIHKFNIKEVINKGIFMGPVSDTSEDYGKLLYAYNEVLYPINKEDVLLKKIN